MAHSALGGGLSDPLAECWPEAEFKAGGLHAASLRPTAGAFGTHSAEAKIRRGRAGTEAEIKAVLVQQLGSLTPEN